MLTSLMGNSFLVLAVLVFVAVVLLLEALYVMWRSHRGPEATKIADRACTRCPRPATARAQTRLLRQRMLSELPHDGALSAARAARAPARPCSSCSPA